MGDTLTLMYSFVMKIKVHILISHCLLFTHIEVYRKKSFYPVILKIGIYNASYIPYNDKTLQSRMKMEWSIHLEQKSIYRLINFARGRMPFYDYSNICSLIVSNK